MIFIVVSGLGTDSKGPENKRWKWRLEEELRLSRQTGLLRSARILRKVLET